MNYTALMMCVSMVAFSAAASAQTPPPAAAPAMMAPAAMAPAAMAPAAMAPVAASTHSLAEREAMESTEAAAAKSALRVQQACGNPAFSFHYDWAAYDGVNYSLAAQGPNTPKSTIFKMADMFSGALASDLITICTSDPAGKAEIAKLTSVDLTPRKDGSAGLGMHIVKAGALLSVDYYPFALSGSQDVVADLKKAL